MVRAFVLRVLGMTFVLFSSAIPVASATNYEFCDPARLACFQQYEAPDPSCSHPGETGYGGEYVTIRSGVVNADALVVRDDCRADGMGTSRFLLAVDAPASSGIILSWGEFDDGRCATIVAFAVATQGDFREAGCPAGAPPEDIAGRRWGNVVP